MSELQDKILEHVTDERLPRYTITLREVSGSAVIPDDVYLTLIDCGDIFITETGINTGLSVFDTKSVRIEKAKDCDIHLETIQFVELRDIEECEVVLGECPAVKLEDTRSVTYSSRKTDYQLFRAKTGKYEFRQAVFATPFKVTSGSIRPDILIEEVTMAETVKIVNSAIRADNWITLSDVELVDKTTSVLNNIIASGGKYLVDKGHWLVHKLIKSGDELRLTETNSTIQTGTVDSVVHHERADFLSDQTEFKAKVTLDTSVGSFLGVQFKDRVNIDNGKYILEDVTAEDVVKGSNNQITVNKSNLVDIDFSNGSFRIDFSEIANAAISSAMVDLKSTVFGTLEATALHGLNTIKKITADIATVSGVDTTSVVNSFENTISKLTITSLQDLVDHGSKYVELVAKDITNFAATTIEVAADTVIEGIENAIIGHASKFAKLTLDNVNGVVGEITADVVEAVGSVLSTTGLSNLIVSASSVVQDLESTISSIADSSLKALNSTVTNALNSTINGLSNSIGTLTSSILKGAENTVTNAVDSLLNGASNVITNLTDSIVEGASNAVTTALRSTVSGAQNSIQNAIDSVISGVGGTVQSAIGGVVTGTVEALTGTALGVLEGVSSGLDHTISAGSGALGLDTTGTMSATSEGSMSIASNSSTVGISGTSVNITNPHLLGTLLIDADLIPETDNVYDIGSVSFRWNDLFIGGTATLENLHVLTSSLLYGDTDIGEDNADTVTFNAVVDSDFLPNTDNTHSIGSATLEWNDLHIDGTAHIDTLTVDENVDSHLIPLTDSNYDLGSDTLQWNDLHSSGTSFLFDLDVNNNTTLGADSDSLITFTGSVNSSILFQSADTYDIGTSSVGLRDLYVNSKGTFGSIESGDIDSSGNLSAASIYPNLDNTFDLGNFSLSWRNLFADGVANLDIANIGDVNSSLIPLDYTIVNVSGESVTKGSGFSSDNLNNSDLHSVRRVYQGSVTYIQGTDFSVNLTLGQISWLGGGKKPSDFTTYWVEYYYTDTETTPAYTLGSLLSKWEKLWVNAINVGAGTNTALLDIESNVDTGLTLLRVTSYSGTDSLIVHENTNTETKAIIAGGNVTPSADDSSNLGSATKRWQNLYVTGVGSHLVPTTSGTWALGNGTNKWKVLHIENEIYTSEIYTGSAYASFVLPNTPGASDLGNATIQWRDLYVDGTAFIDTLNVEESVGTSLVPNADNTHDLGGSSIQWKDLYIDGTAFIDTLNVEVGVGTSLVPVSSVTYNLGLSTSNWNRLYARYVSIENETSGHIAVKGFGTNNLINLKTSSSSQRFRIDYAGTTYLNGVWNDGAAASSSFHPIMISSDGRVRTAYSDVSVHWNNVSSQKYKNRKQPYTKGYEDIQEILPFYYEWKDKDGIDSDLHLGFIAEDIWKVSPESNLGDSSFDNRSLMAIMVSAINTLIDKVEYLEGKINAIDC